MEMETLQPANNGGGIKRYLRRRHYQRLQRGATPSGKKMKIVRLKRSPRKHWRIRTIPRLRWVIKSPLKILANLKNAYMNFMLKSLNTDIYSSNAFDARLIYEISKALVASHDLCPM